MTVDHISLTVYLAAAALWVFEPLNPEGLAQTCVSSKAPRTEVIAACTNLIEAGDVTPDYQHLFLTKRAWAHRCDGHYELAIADVDRALSLQPENVKTMVLRARIHDANGNHDAAKADYDRAVDTAPENHYTHWNRARYLDRHGERDEAYLGYQKVLELDPDASNAAKYMAHYLYDRKKYEKALGVVTDATDRWPGQRWVYGLKVELDIVHTKDVEGALASAEKAIGMYESPVMKFLFPAAIHLTIGDEQAGIDAVNRYADWFVLRQEQKVSAWDRITAIISEKSDFGEDEKPLRRGIAYAILARADLARPELLQFVEKTGSAGKKEILKWAKKDSELFALNVDSSAERIVDAYVEQEISDPPRWALHN